MFTLMTLAAQVQLAFAGIVQYIVDWGFFASIAAGLVLLGLFSTAIPVVGPYLGAIRKDLYWAAFACVLIMFGMYIGARDATARCKAQQVVITKTVTKAVKKSTTPAAKRQKDRWDNPEY